VRGEVLQPLVMPSFGDWRGAPDARVARSTYLINLLLRVDPLQRHDPLRPLDVHLAEVGTFVLLRLLEVDMEEMGRSINCSQ
jgi:hypothetical protein